MSGFGNFDRFNDTLGGPQFTPLYSEDQCTKFDNNIVKSWIPVYVVASVTEDGYIEGDSCYNDYGKANDRANILMYEDDREWEVLTCKMEY